MVDHVLEVIADRTGGHKAMITPTTTSLLRAPIALALSIGLGAAVPAHASSTTKQDPRNDVFLGSLGGGMDLAAVQLMTLNQKKRIRVTFRLHSPALEGSLEEPGGMTVEFVESKRVWRIVRVATEDGVLRGEVCSHPRRSSIGPHDCSSLPVTQVDAKTYRVVVQLEQVKEGAEVLRWTAGSLDISSGSPVGDSLTAKNRAPFRWRL